MDDKDKELELEIMMAIIETLMKPSTVIEIFESRLSRGLYNDIDDRNEV